MRSAFKMVVLSLGVVAFGAVARDAEAAQVDNTMADGSTTWAVDLDLPGIASSLDFGNGTGFSLVGAGSLTGTLVSDGTFTGDGGYSFPVSATGSPQIAGRDVFATLQVRNVSGAFDIRPGYRTINITLDVRAKFTSSGANIFGTCVTAYKTVTVSTGKTWSGHTPALYNTTDGSFVGVANDVQTFGALSGCNGYASQLSTNHALGSGGNFGIIFAGFVKDPAIMSGS